MKNLSLALNAILLVLLLLLWFNRGKCPECLDGETSKACRIIKGDEHRHQPDHVVPVSTATEMFNLYKNDKSKAWIGGQPQENDSLRDALMFQVPMSRMKNLIWYVEKKLCEAGCSDTSKLAIRAYYAKYPNNVGTPDALPGLRHIKPKFRNKHTLFFVPMYFNGDRWIAFDPDQVHDPCSIVSLTAPGAMKNVYGMMGDEDGVEDTLDDKDASNHGGLHPPPYEEEQTFPPR